MKIDLRSDTVTQPTPAMREAMMQAEVGDDVFGEDPSVHQLEKKCAALLGMDAAVFCPSGTMTNQIGIKVLTQPYEEVICYKGAHIYKYEGGGLAGNSQVSVRLVEGNRGRLSPDDVVANLNSHDPHYPRTAAVALENSVVREAGSYYTLAQMQAVSETARLHGLSVHLDGARLFNALAETGDAAHAIGPHFDTVSICLSKGLGAPVGSVLACKKEWEPKVRRIRKAWGGGMRQAGFLAAAGIYALDHHVSRLREDHQRARELGRMIETRPWVKSVMPVDTNLVIFELEAPLTAAGVVEKLRQKDLWCLPFGPTQIRLVTHLDFTEQHLEQALHILRNLTP